MSVSLQRLIIGPDQFLDQSIRLTTDQQHYLYRVLRLSPGQQFIALNGRGGQWLASLTEDSGRATLLQWLEGCSSHQPTITLAIAIPKGSGFDELVRQTTELGVSTLQPIVTQRTLHRPNPNKLERWRRIAAEATEQSERLWLPTLKAPLAWTDFVALPDAGQRYLCVARQSPHHLLTHLQHLEEDLRAIPITIATGPEGGWTAAEIDQALQGGFCPVSLGPTILRAVTAPLAALAMVTAAINSVSWGTISE